MPENKICVGEAGVSAFEQLQDVFCSHNLEVTEGICAASDFFVWALMLAFVKKEDAKDYVGKMLPDILSSIDANWPALEARRKILAALDAGESGGRMQ